MWGDLQVSCCLCYLGKNKLILNSFKWRLVSCLNPFPLLLCRSMCTYTFRNGTSSKLCSLLCGSLATFLLAPWKAWHVLASFSVPLCVPVCLSHICSSEDSQIGAGILLGLSHLEVEFSRFLFVFVCFGFFPPEKDLRDSIVLYLLKLILDWI